MCFGGLLADMDEGLLTEILGMPKYSHCRKVLHMVDGLMEAASWSPLSVNLPENTCYGVELHTASRRCWREGRRAPHDPLPNPFCKIIKKPIFC